MKIGPNDIDNLKIGSQDVGAAYMGGTKVWPEQGPPPAGEDKFIFRIQTTEPNQNIVLPATGTNDFLVVWGDGNSEQVNYTSPSHIYDDVGEYTVSLDGLCSRWFYNNGGDKDSVLEVINLGHMGWTHLNNSFYGCINMTSFVAGDTDVSAVLSCAQFIENGDSLIHLDLSGFNSINVTNMTRGMQNLTNIEETPNLVGFKTDSVTVGSSLFATWSSVLIPLMSAN